MSNNEKQERLNPEHEPESELVGPGPEVELSELVVVPPPSAAPAASPPPAPNGFVQLNDEDDEEEGERERQNPRSPDNCPRGDRAIYWCVGLSITTACILVFLLPILNAAGVFDSAHPSDPHPEPSPDPTLNGLLNFLKTNVTIPDRNHANAPIPVSYDVESDYWKWVCQTEGSCTPINTDPNNPASQFQTERVLSAGSNIYDASLWQMVMALTKNMPLADNQNNFLDSGHTADANLQSRTRATTSNDNFQYNGHPITQPNHAYFFRTLAPTFINRDPLAGWQGIPADAKQSWVDWKPITGENAWANYIAPLQVLYAKHNGNLASIPLAAMERSHGVLMAVRAMQARIGAIYYTTSVASNQGNAQVNPYSVSVENTLSVLSGLSMYRAILMAQNPNGKFSDGVTVFSELQAVNEVITRIKDFLQNDAFDRENNCFYQGGVANDPAQNQSWVPAQQPFAVDVQTWGISVLGPQRIDDWFGEGTAYQMWEKVKAMAGYFGETGSPTDSLQGVGYSNQVEPITTQEINITVTNNNVADTNNLRVFALWEDSSPLEISKAGGIAFGESQKVTIPMHSSLGSPLVRLQFLDENNNEVAAATLGTFNEDARLNVAWNSVVTTFTRYIPQHEIFSSEWTFGAINAVETLIDHYENDTALNASLCEDNANMREGVLALRTDNFQGTPNIPVGSSSNIAYMYANTRYAIPLGWTANPVPSTCATSWAALTLHLDFNPLYLGGERPVDPLAAPSEQSVHANRRLSEEEEVSTSVDQQPRSSSFAVSDSGFNFFPKSREMSSDDIVVARADAFNGATLD